MAGQEDDVLFREFGNPEDYKLTGGILLPVTETNFTIHPQYIRMVQSEQFSGFPSEDPIEHLDRFLELCAMIQSNQVSQESGTSYDGPNEGDSEEKKGGEESVNEDKRGEKEKVHEVEGSSEKMKLDNEETTSIPSETRNLDGPVPFPSRLAERKLNDKFAKFLSVMKNLHINLPFIEVVTQMPSYSKFLKDILTNKRKLNDELITLPHQVNSLAQHKTPKKEKDPGSFTLPVKIGNMEARGALADLGANVSLIPLSIAQKLNIEMIPTRKTIQLADRSVKFPCGELEDVPIQVGYIYVPCDFVMMDMEEDVDTPLILGREALKTLEAVINFKNNTITCEVADKKIVFEFSKLLKTPWLKSAIKLML
ncbi:uncharacterized protein LOC110699255 [Chenopodium quinoa]|uniref:uncharacterized protein LOC110699255 n=1 Tax=Chenopodium quinoa TaxID=63459 RepID=UPI000B781C21|nr:uncharacterized protein LOC110699255 [Chenopodium quinoa]